MRGIFLVLLFFSLADVSAQGRFTFLEVDIGLDVASIQPCKIQHDWVTNPYARILYKFEWKEGLYIMSGIAFQPKGTKKRFLYEPVVGQEEVGSATLTLQYLTIPLIAELEYPLGDSDLKFYLNGGAFYSVLMSDEWEISMEETTYETTNIDQKKDAGLLIGTGLGLLVGDRWEIIARFSIEYGLEFWTVRHPWADIQNVKSRNYPITLGASYLLTD